MIRGQSFFDDVLGRLVVAIFRLYCSPLAEELNKKHG